MIMKTVVTIDGGDRPFWKGGVMSLTEAILKVQGAVAKVGRDGTNPHTRSGYPTLEAVLDVLNTPLQEAGIVVKQYTAFAEGQWRLRTEVRVGGESESFDLPLLGLEGSKNPMQAIGSALTYSRRYALMAFFKLAPTDDDAESLTVVQEKKAPEKKQPWLGRTSAWIRFTKARRREATR